MSELKTLKDLVTAHDSKAGQYALRQAAIEHVKSNLGAIEIAEINFKKGEQKARDILLLCAAQNEWIIDFFNLTEEDLK